MDFDQLAKWADTLGVIAILLGVILAGHKRVWVWGYQLEKSEAQCTKWQDVAERNQKSVERLIDIYEAAQPRRRGGS